jgi:Phosphosulfolactate phosphohydrolase and related enzymes
MPVPIDVELVAKDACNATARGDLVIVIDLVRATTCIITAIANGARSITPVCTLKQAKYLRSEHPAYVLAGERNGVKPSGFDLDNSPLTLTRENVDGKNLIMSTTNGTNALVQSEGADWIIVGAFVNASATAKASLEIACKNKIGVSFVLAGQKNRFALEDFICAGGIITRFPEDAVELSDKALSAMLAFEGAEHDLPASIRRSGHAQELIKIGLGRDIEFACQIDLYRIVPFYRNGVITALK